MKIQFKLILGEFANDIVFNTQANSLLEKLKEEEINRFNYHIDPDNKNIFIVETFVSIAKNLFVPSFKNLIKDFCKDDEATQHYIIREIKISFKLETSQAGFRHGDFDTFYDYINSDIFQ